MTTVDLTLDGRTPAPQWPGDLYAEAIRTGRGPLFLRRPDGWLLPLDIERWCGDVDAADALVLRRCRGRVMDIGCGPGRFTAALQSEPAAALGIDINAEAVKRTVQSGGNALRRSVFEPLPAEGTWTTALLMDGNIGIGGDPATLLKRVGAIVATGGMLLAEVAPVDVDERVTVHVDDGRGERGADFPWARVGVAALARLCKSTGWRVVDHWHAADRCFAALRSTA